MPRFSKMNRWWTLILALSVGCVLAASMSTRASAGASMFDELGQRWSSGGGGSTPPPGDGDPDIPMSSLKRALPMAQSQPAASVSTRPVVGDGIPVDSVMMWHFRVVLQSLRLWSFPRF